MAATGWTKRRQAPGCRYPSMPQAGLKFGLQFTAVRGCPGKIAHRRWSRVNGSGRPRPEHDADSSDDSNIAALETHSTDPPNRQIPSDASTSRSWPELIRK